MSQPKDKKRPNEEEVTSGTDHKRPNKKVKQRVTIENYEKQSDHALLKLPNELYMHIFSYLVGDLMCNIDISSIEVTVDSVGDTLHKQVLDMIPPFENLKAISRLNLVCKDFCKMVRGENCDDESEEEEKEEKDALNNESERSENEEEEEKEEPIEYKMNDFQRFWLSGFNFYFKLLYWIRTRRLENMTLAYGDMTQKDYIEIAKAQNVILHNERGKCLKTFFDTFDYDQFTGEVEMDASDREQGDEEEVADEACKADEKEDTNKENHDFYKKIFQSRKPTYNNPEQSKEVLLRRLKQLEIDPRAYIRYFRDDTCFELCFDVMVMISLHMFDSFDSDETDYYTAGNGILIPEDNLISWISGDVRDVEKKELENMENQKLGVSIHNNGGFAKFLTNSLEDLSLEKIKNLTIEDVKVDIITKQLEKVIFLHLENVLLFKPLVDFEFPLNINYLSIDLNSSTSYEGYTEEDFKDALRGIIFPGVRYLRMRFEEDAFHCANISFDDLKNKILKFATDGDIFPNLRYLTLNGIGLDKPSDNEDDGDVIDMDHLRQLIGFEISFNNDCREHKYWNEFRKVTLSLSRESHCLRHVILETEVDSRGNPDISKWLEKLYKTHKRPFSIGFASVSHFYSICGE